MFVYTFTIKKLGVFKVGISVEPVKRVEGLSKFYDLDDDSVMIYNFMDRSKARSAEAFVKCLLKKYQKIMPYDGGTEFFELAYLEDCKKILESSVVAIHSVSAKVDLMNKHEVINEAELSAAEIGQSIKIKRKEIGMTQCELSQATGVSKRTVERLESGESVCLSNALAVLNKLGISAPSLRA